MINELGERKMKMRKILLWPLSVLVFGGCALPPTDQRHFDPELEKRERDLMIRKDFATGEEKRLIEKDIYRIQNNYIAAPEDVLEMILVPANRTKLDTDKTIDDKIMKSLGRSQNETQIK